MNKNPSETNNGPIGNPWTEADIFIRAQLLLRILGVYFVISGACHLLIPLVWVFYNWWTWFNYASTWAVTFYTIADSFMYLLSLIVGLYLVIDGRWVIEKVFLRSSSKESDNSENEQVDINP